MAADPLTRSTVDDLFAFELSDIDDDPFADKPVTTLADTRDDKAVLSPKPALKRKVDDDDFGLGLDSEVRIVKKKKPVAKLDEARLLSEPGIPKLRALTRTSQLAKKLRFKGKGHEFTDAARLLNHFQLWLDNLYPRAKFADALQLVEKAGHTKRMNITRTEWINEGKPGYIKFDERDASGEQLGSKPDLFSNGEQAQLGPIVPDGVVVSNDDDALFIPDSNPNSGIDRDDEPDDDELDALLAEQTTSSSRMPGPQPTESVDASEGEDDLDALLAEQDLLRNYASTKAGGSSQRRSTGPSHNEIDDEDELDALLAEHNMQQSELSNVEKRSSATAIPRAIQDDPSPYEHGRIEPEASLDATHVQARSIEQRQSIEPDLPLFGTANSSMESPTKSTGQTLNDQSPPDTSDRNKGPLMIFSSSPMPNNPEDVDLDDLDALLASQETKSQNVSTHATDRSHADKDGSATPKARKIGRAQDELLSSSPIPNHETS